MNTKISSLLSEGALLLALCASCSRPDSMPVTVANDSPRDRAAATVAIPLADIAGRIGGPGYAVSIDGREIPSQITHDSLLIFQATVAAGSEAVYTVARRDTMPVYDAVATGRLYPERADDLAWENDLVGFRAYGPSTQAKGERAYGYDIFFKHPTPEPVLEKLYGPETDPRTWATVDSLRAISDSLADEYISTFSYHIDHGLGMDCYAVGPTLGAGVAALVQADTLSMPWCYARAEVLDRGPVRFTARLDFAPRGGVTEHRIVSLDASSHLNSCAVWYDGLRGPEAIAAGFPRRDDSPMLAVDGTLAFSDPTQGPDNGRALLGIVMPGRRPSDTEALGHVMLRDSIAPGDTLRYYWGFAWDRTDIRDLNAWSRYLTDFSADIANPLKISY